MDASSDDSSPATTDSSTSTDATDAIAVADADPYGAYPPGPYGQNEGDTLEGFTWEGYVNESADAISNTKPYVTTSTDKLRRAGKYGLVHVAEFI
ncbi:MAG: hypothetical protein ACXVIJ_14435 [Thermoanaerobaculia bacterium]